MNVKAEIVSGEDLFNYLQTIASELYDPIAERYIILEPGDRMWMYSGLSNSDAWDVKAKADEIAAYWNDVLEDRPRIEYVGLREIISICDQIYKGSWVECDSYDYIDVNSEKIAELAQRIIDIDYWGAQDADETVESISAQIRNNPTDVIEWLVNALEEAQEE